MATTVEIKNYKTIKHAKFTIDGYTILLGKNYIGKSALITSIVAALTNRSGDDFIRHGEKFAEVAITHGKYHIIWHKEAKNNFYMISDGVSTKEYKKAGKAELPPELNELGFGPIEVGGKKNLLWYAKQFEVLFLIDKPRQGATTDLVASVTNLDTIYKAVDIAKKELKLDNSSLKIRRSDLRVQEERLGGYKPLEEYEKDADKLESLSRGQLILSKEIKYLEKAINEIEVHTNTLKRYHPVNTLKAIPTKIQGTMIADIEKLESLISDYEKHNTWYEGKISVFKELVGSNNGSTLIAQSNETLRELEKVSKNNRDFQTAVSNYKNAELITKVPKAGKALKALEGDLQEYSHISALNSTYEKLISVVNSQESLKGYPEVTLNRELLVEIDKINSLQVDLKESVTELKTAGAELQKAKEASKEIEKELSKFKTCDKCGSLL